MAAENALNNSPIVEIEISETISLQFDYLMVPDIMKVVKDFGFKILEQDFKENGSMKINVPTRQKEKFADKLNLLRALGKKIMWKVDAELS